MFPQLIVFASILLVSSALSGLSDQEFDDFIRPMCYPKMENPEDYLINGQTNPLSNTLENFISLAEKFEDINPDLKLKQELFYFLRNYTYENLEFNEMGLKSTWKPGNMDYTDLENMWEPNESDRVAVPKHNDPFSDEEKCSLFFMLSHSVVTKAPPSEIQRSFDNKTRLLNTENVKMYPQEQGVVAIKGTAAAVSLSRVFTGMYIGLTENRLRSPDSFTKNVKCPPAEKASGASVDPLHMLTVSEIIAVSSWPYGKTDRNKTAPDGVWMSDPRLTSDIKNICPMIYRLPNGTESVNTYSSLRGAADGLILGQVIREIERAKSNVKLSQILRMYYSNSGALIADYNGLQPVRSSFCNRDTIMYSMEKVMEEQLLLFEWIASKSCKDEVKNTEYAWRYYLNIKREAFELAKKRYEEIDDHCNQEIDITRPDTLPIETPLDIIIVLDTRDGEESLRKQQLAVGYFAKNLSLSYSNSLITILLNEKNQSASTTDATVVLKTLVTDSSSFACAACVITQYDHERADPAPVDDVVSAVEKILKTKKEKEVDQNGVKGKVFVYFHLQEKEEESTASKVDRAFSDLFLRHKDLSIFVLGKNNLPFLQKYARGDKYFVLSAIDGEPDAVAKHLFDRLSRASPAALQYKDCETGRNENLAVYEDFVSPLKRQHWRMPAEYFYKSRGFKVTFESQYGSLRVCYARVVVPEQAKDFCKNATSGDPAIFKDSNPCKDMTKGSCSPLFFTVMGNSSNSETNGDQFCSDSNNGNKCRTIDQIKFKVVHEGIRCSGSIGLMSAPIFVLLGIFLSHTLLKLF